MAQGTRTRRDPHSLFYVVGASTTSNNSDDVPSVLLQVSGRETASTPSSSSVQQDSRHGGGRKKSSRKMGPMTTERQTSLLRDSSEVTPGSREEETVTQPAFPSKNAVAQIKRKSADMSASGARVSLHHSTKQRFKGESVDTAIVSDRYERSTYSSSRELGTFGKGNVRNRSSQVARTLYQTSRGTEMTSSFENLRNKENSRDSRRSKQIQTSASLRRAESSSTYGSSNQHQLQSLKSSKFDSLYVPIIPPFYDAYPRGPSWLEKQMMKHQKLTSDPQFFFQTDDLPYLHPAVLSSKYSKTTSNRRAWHDNRRQSSLPETDLMKSSNPSPADSLESRKSRVIPPITPKTLWEQDDSLNFEDDVGERRRSAESQFTDSLEDLAKQSEPLDLSASSHQGNDFKDSLETDEFVRMVAEEDDNNQAGATSRNSSARADARIVRGEVSPTKDQEGQNELMHSQGTSFFVSLDAAQTEEASPTGLALPTKLQEKIRKRQEKLKERSKPADRKKKQVEVTQPPPRQPTPPPQPPPLPQPKKPVSKPQKPKQPTNKEKIQPPGVPPTKKPLDVEQAMAIIERELKRERENQQKKPQKVANRNTAALPESNWDTRRRGHLGTISEERDDSPAPCRQRKKFTSRIPRRINKAEQEMRRRRRTLSSPKQKTIIYRKSRNMRSPVIRALLPDAVLEEKAKFDRTKNKFLFQGRCTKRVVENGQITETFVLGNSGSSEEVTPPKSPSRIPQPKPLTPLSNPRNLRYSKSQRGWSTSLSTSSSSSSSSLSIPVRSPPGQVPPVNPKPFVYAYTSGQTVSLPKDISADVLKESANWVLAMAGASPVPIPFESRVHMKVTFSPLVTSSPMPSRRKASDDETSNSQNSSVCHCTLQGSDDSRSSGEEGNTKGSPLPTLDVHIDITSDADGTHNKRAHFD